MQHRSHTRLWLIVSLVAVLVVVGSTFAWRVQLSSTAAAGLLRATAVPSSRPAGLIPVTPPPVTMQPDTLAPTEAVAGNATPAPTSPYGPARQAIFDQIATDQAQPPGPKGVYRSPTPHATLAITPRRGIIDEQQTLFKHIIRVKNMWVGYEQGQSLSIEVGASYDDPSLGIVIEQIGEIGEPGSHGNTYFTPIRAGAVHIVAANETGTLLTLQSEDGPVFVLDRTTGQFVDSPPSNYPTATPGPSPVVYPAPIS